MHTSRMVAGLALILSAGAALAQGESEFAAGREEYLAACAACHGEAADGNGPIATMFRDPVPGLTGIAAANGGVFPVVDIVKVVDGRTAVRAHGDPMPVFGRRYQTELAGQVGVLGAQEAVRGQVLELVYFLQSIQE